MKIEISKGLVLFCLMFMGTASLRAYSALLERGTYLMESIVACANCHTPKDSATGEEIEGMA